MTNMIIEKERSSMNKERISPEVKERSRAVKFLLRFLIYAGILAIIWRLASGSWGGWYGWLYISLDVALGILAAIWVPLTPEMEQERTSIKAGVKQWDKYIVIPLSVWYPFGVLVLAGIDSRFGWSSNIPAALIYLATIAAVGGRIISTWAAASNPFYGRFVRIQTERGHIAVDQGPYRYIRHPGYSGLSIFLLCAGIILNSWWTLLANVLAVGALILRTVLEDRTLQDELSGYAAYAQEVRYRLLPGVW